MCMMHSVENRAPLLDFKLFEFMMTVPEKYKISKEVKSCREIFVNISYLIIF